MISTLFSKGLLEDSAGRNTPHWGYIEPQDRGCTGSLVGGSTPPCQPQHCETKTPKRGEGNLTKKNRTKKMYGKGWRGGQTPPPTGMGVGGGRPPTTHRISGIPVSPTRMDSDAFNQKPEELPAAFNYWVPQGGGAMVKGCQAL